MDNIRNDVVYLDLVRHIKQYLKEFKCSFFDQETEEVKNAIEKHQGGEELTPEELLMVAEHIVANNVIKGFKDDILYHDSIIFPDDKKEIFSDIIERFTPTGIYLLYESYYVMRFLDEAPRKIKRALSLRKILVTDEISLKIKEYCKEAYRCYLNGHFNASIILLRAIIEQALKDKYNIDTGMLEPTRTYLINNGLISDELSKQIIKIRDGGNKAVHNITRNKQASESYNKHLIEVGQNILKSLFN
jgi:hypothetical protein